MLDLAAIRALSFDLDDTLWPIGPTIVHAEEVLLAWLRAHAPATAAVYATPAALRAIRESMAALRPDLRHDLSAMRRESIRLALRQAGDDPALAEPAFEAFFAARQQVVLYADVASALVRLARRYPLVALSNGNADIGRVGLGAHFAAAVSATEFGVPKPDPRIFHEAARRLDLPAHAVLHVGDDVAADVLGAHAAGMQAVWVNRHSAGWPHADRPAPADVGDLAALCELLGV